jgi:hypothetical protein
MVGVEVMRCCGERYSSQGNFTVGVKLMRRCGPSTRTTLDRRYWSGIVAQSCSNDGLLLFLFFRD